MEEKQLNMPDEHPVPKAKKEKGKAGTRVLLLLILILVAGATIGYYSTNAASQPKNWINILPASRALISTQWKVCSRAPIFPLLTMQMCETPPTKASSNPSMPK